MIAQQDQQQAEIERPGEVPAEAELTLLELLDRVLDKGVVLSGDITLSVADVDLVYVGLRVLLSAAETAQRLQSQAPAIGDST
jgi:hypothetical protein